MKEGTDKHTVQLLYASLQGHKNFI